MKLAKNNSTMPITPQTPLSEINRQLEEQVERIRRATVRSLCVAGEEALNAARSTVSYKDQTGNLRSSIGYVVVCDGQIVKMSDFAPSDVGTDKATGQKTGKAYAQELASKYPSGVVMIMVAGMNYAVYVQRRFDVLDSSELKANEIIPQLLSNLNLTD